MNADRIRRLDDKKGILVTSNQEPILFRARPFYQDGRMKGKTKTKRKNRLKSRVSPNLKFFPLEKLKRAITTEWQPLFLLDFLRKF